MTDEERQLLLDLGRLSTENSRQMMNLVKERNDMLIGFAAALLDVYRMLFAAHADTKQAAVVRLRTQCDELANRMPDAAGETALRWLADSLDAEVLDAAALCGFLQPGQLSLYCR